MARFGLELVIFGIAVFSLIANLTITAHASLLESKDQSVIFSFLQNNPSWNKSLLATSGTTTLLARGDQWVSAAQAQTSYTSMDNVANVNGLTTIQDNVIVKTNPADTENFMRHGTTQYTVAPGDSVVSIASNFGISPQTIMLENKMDSSSTLKTGQVLTILPTTGISHVVGPTETVESIAAKYKVSEEDILDLNNIELAEDVSPGATLIIPLAQVNVPTPTTIVKNSTNQIALKKAPVPADLSGSTDFMWPTVVKTITQGFSKIHSGVDISDSKKEVTYAAADGFVELSGWQNGYGNTIIINHGNGYKTLYGHSSEIYVKAGDHVTKGQVIAKQGNTGRVSGITGIHLHFEIIKNGVRVNPLAYVHP